MKNLKAEIDLLAETDQIKFGQSGQVTHGNIARLLHAKVARAAETVTVRNWDGSSHTVEAFAIAIDGETIAHLGEYKVTYRGGKSEWAAINDGRHAKDKEAGPRTTNRIRAINDAIISAAWR